jgi:hypothetical protein
MGMIKCGERGETGDEPVGAVSAQSRAGIGSGAIGWA